MPKLPLRVAVAVITAALTLPLAPASQASPPTAVRTSATSAAAPAMNTAADTTAERRHRGSKQRSRPQRRWTTLTTYKRAQLQACRPAAPRHWHLIVLRLRNAHEKRDRRAQVSFKDRNYSLPWNTDARTVWVRPGRGAALTRVSTTGRLRTQRLRVRLSTRQSSGPRRSFRWTEAVTCRAPHRPGRTTRS